VNVEELLYSKQVPFLPKGKDYVVSCLSPEHDDSNPSMRVDQITGIFHCFSCGYKGNLFVHFGEKASFLHLRRELIKKKIREKRAESVGLPFPPSALPYVGNWRGIKPDTYRKFEAFQDHEHFIGRVVFPIRDISGKIVAFNARHMTGGTPKYLINPDKLSIFRLQGVEHAVVFFDGDEAGQKAAANVKQMCENVDLMTRNINIPDNDPGGLSENQVQKLKQKLYS